MQENNNENSNITQNNNLRENNYWKHSLGILAAAFLGGFLAMYFVADQIFDKHNQFKYYSVDKFEKQMLKDFKKMYEHEKRMLDHDIDTFDFDFFDNSNKKFSKDFNKKFAGKWLEDNYQDNSILNSFIMTDLSLNNIKIDTDIDENNYRVIVSLSPFNGDESKVNYNVSGRKLTVFGNSNIEDKNFSQDISFSHDFILPYNANITNISKKKKGNKLVIDVPLKK